MNRHPLAWGIWAVGLAVAALLTRHPVYLAALALGAWLVLDGVGRGAPQGGAWHGLLKVGVFVWALTIPFNALMIHAGDYVLFSLPEDWPLVGGAITLEAVLYGAASGLAIWTLLLIFAAFNLATDASQLLRLAPAFLYPMGVVTSIGLTFVPQLLHSAREIREAQQIRGHRFRGWRDLLPLFVPLLTTSLERAIQLAESMEARGFGGQLSGLAPGAMARLRLAMLAALALLLCGLLARSYWGGGWSTALLGAAAVALLGAFWMVGRHVQRSRYRRARWAGGDTAVAVAGLALLAAVIALRTLRPEWLAYSPYPPNAVWPDTHLWVALVFGLGGLPGLAMAWARRRADSRPAAPLEELT